MDNLENSEDNPESSKLNYTWVFGLALVGVIAGYTVSRYFEGVEKK